MSKQWEVSLRLKQQIVDGKMSPAKADVKKWMGDLLETSPFTVMKDTLSVTNKTTGGRRSKDSGSDYERKIAKELGGWWWGQPFRRTPNSGGWDKQSTDGKVMASGDLIAPPEAEFPFSIECKHRKEPVNFFAITIEGSDYIFDWWRQCVGDSEAMRQYPLLIIGAGRVEYAVFNKTHLVELCKKEEVEPQGHKSGLLDVFEKGSYIFTIMLLKDFLLQFESCYGKETKGKTEPFLQA